MAGPGSKAKVNRAARLAAAAAIAAATLTACGSDKEAAPPVDSTPKKGGVFRQGLVRTSSTDPAVARSVSERVIADELYDGLVTWNATTLEAAPALAQRWDMSTDLKQWTFHLRPDAKAGNGDPVTAADVKATFQHLARKATGSPVTSLLAPVLGFAAFTDDPAATDLPGVVVVDPQTVRFDLDQPVAEFVQMLGNPSFGIVHTLPDGSPISTGPFFLASRDGDRSLNLLPSPGAAVYVDRIAVMFYDDVDQVYADFVANKLDWSPVPAAKAKEAADAYGRHLFKPSLRTLYLSFNLANPKFADVRFREAIAHAIDRRALDALLTGGDGSLLDGVSSDAVPAEGRSSCADRCAYDPERAKRLVADVFPGAAPPPFTIDVAGGPPFNEAAAKRITDDLATAGIAVNVRGTAVDQFPAVTVSPDREVFQTSWSGLYPSAETFLAPLFSSASPSNVSVFKDAAVDVQLAKARAEVDPAARRRAFAAAERSIVDALAVVPLAQFPVESVERSDVHGIDVLPTGNFDATKVWLDLPTSAPLITTPTTKR